MTLDRLEQNWQALGEQDPLWAILSSPEKRGGGWELDEFFASGSADVDEVLETLGRQGIRVGFDRALDFGCGVGRLTRALATHFDRCDGVDLAASMIEHARELGSSPSEVHFHHNEATDLRLFDDGTFDLVLSLYVLQHMEPELMRGYLSEFVRVLGPGGVAYFNVPERTVSVEPLPSGAWCAAVSLAAPLPRFEAGGASALELTVRNAGRVAWPADAQVRLGCRWRAPTGGLIPAAEGRTPIEGSMAPGESRRLGLVAVAPARPGGYELEVDLLQEEISWFADRGSASLRLNVQVDPGRELRAAAERESVPAIEMHTLPRAEVTRAVEGAGGVVLAAIARDRCGPAMPSLDYVVGRAG